MPDTIGDLARQDLYPDERYMQPPVNPVDLPPEAYASLGGGDLGLLGKYGINVAKGLGNLAMIPGQAYQSTQDSPVTTEQLIKPATDLALATAGTASPFAQRGALGATGGKMTAPGDLAALGEYHPPFYSAVERAVQDAKQNTAPGQQWAGYLRNQPGVKPEEVETLGLGKLFEQPTVSKDALLGEIAANKVNVGEVVKRDPDPAYMNERRQRMDEIEAEQYRIQDRFNELHEAEQAGTDRLDPQVFAEREQLAQRNRELDRERRQVGTELIDQGAGDKRPKFSQYTLPGGENYRETLLTLPTQDAAKSERMTQLEQQLRNPADYDTAELFDMRNEYRRLANETRDSPTFKSSHYDEPNILAHVRYNDRVIDGKKTLFVEEVQSDWHQKGKREGYRTADQDKQQAAYNKHVADGVPPFEAMRLAEDEFKSGTVPDAPFKTTWPDLAMKRVIREAAEKGYDKVAWTPGSVQADRYDLSKHIKRITLEPSLTGGGSEYLAAYDHSGKRVIDKIVTREEMPDLIGKDVAEKLINQPEKKIPAQLGLPGSTTPIRELSGLDLKVGGEGMKGFYDQILPATVNRLVKKHGARVTQGEIPPVVSPAMQEKYPRSVAQAGTKVHTLDITPSLRAAAMKGFPLFTAGGIAATGMMSDLAKQDDYQ